MKSLIVVAATALTLTLATAAHAGAPMVMVEKSATCGCCAGWVEHMRANGFEVQGSYRVEDRRHDIDLCFG